MIINKAKFYINYSKIYQIITFNISKLMKKC